MSHLWHNSNFSICTLFFFNFFFYFTILFWFCHTSTWIRQGCTRAPHPEPPSHLPPCTIPLGHPSAPAPSILYHASNLDWQFISYMILYMFQCHSPKSSPPLPLPQSPKEDLLFKTVEQPGDQCKKIGGLEVWADLVDTMMLADDTGDASGIYVPNMVLMSFALCYFLEKISFIFKVSLHFGRRCLIWG